MSAPRVRLPRNSHRQPVAVVDARLSAEALDAEPGEGEAGALSADALRGQPLAEPPPGTREESRWLDLDAVAEVTIVAGGRRFPRSPQVWSADCSGEQTIEVRFREPTSLSRLRVICSEAEQSRTQEMTVWASLHRGEQHREVVRQQFNFSPDGATEEVEEYALQLEAVSTIELRIVPSIDGRPAVARVDELRLATTSTGA